MLFVNLLSSVFFSNVKVYHIVASCASRIEAPSATCRFISRCCAPTTTYRCQQNYVPRAASDWDGGTVAVFCGRNISVKYFRVRKHATCVLSQWFEAQERLRCMRLSCRIIMYHRFAIFLERCNNFGGKRVNLVLSDFNHLLGVGKQRFYVFEVSLLFWWAFDRIFGLVWNRINETNSLGTHFVTALQLCR